MGESKSRRTIAWLLLFLALTSLIFAGCRPAKKNPKNQAFTLPRPSPAYIQFLTQQSMTGQAANLIAQVSGTDRMWRFSGTDERYALLLKEAPTWLAIQPQKAPNPLFAHLAAGETLARVRDCAIQGIYLAQTGETDAAWTKNPLPDPYGERVASFSFAKCVGDDDDFARYAGAAAAANLQIGGSLPPAATGMGPDFMLATRAHPSYEGLYASLPLPKETWYLLPNIEQGDVASLSKKTCAALVEKGILPESLRKEKLPWANASGWAVTAEITGADGNKRRFAYSFDTDIYRPVLLWQDPSGYARRLYAAAVIRHTGLQQHTLAGLPLKALMGLDANRQGESVHNGPADLEPGISAFTEISQAVHRYGGWSMTTESYPAEVLATLSANVDFFYDAKLTEAFSAALAKEDARPIVALIKHYEDCGLPQKRLVHSTPENDTVLSQNLLLSLALPVALPGLCFLAPEYVDKGLPERDTKTLRTLLGQRRNLRAAEGAIAITKTKPSTLVIENRLPGGDIWLVALNFSQKETVPIALRGAGSFFDLATKNRLEEMTNASGQRILTLKPREARHILLSQKTFPHF
ncbi:MAG: hypothetical protein IJU76_09965 [Desulfovibrionaceae bacterium]|nr:hypothetical protein [Desulfovibrionaceae bacterium]